MLPKHLDRPLTFTAQVFQVFGGLCILSIIAWVFFGGGCHNVIDTVGGALQWLRN
jgi:hypothetical protein